MSTIPLGFEKSLLPFLKPHHTHALILGTGGAAAAVQWALEKLNIQFQLVSRKTNTIEENTELKTSLSYDQLSASVIESHTLIINTSPVGMFPIVNESPSIAYEGCHTPCICVEWMWEPFHVGLEPQPMHNGFIWNHALTQDFSGLFISWLTIVAAME